MQKSKLFLAVLGSLAAMPVMADEEEINETESPISGEVRVVSNYLYRGISQTGEKPALQGSVAYEHSSGLYGELEASTSSFFKDLYTETAGVEGASDANYEFDVYLGFKNEFAEDFHYDVGFMSYNFPGNYAPGATKGDTSEIYGAFGYKWLTAKYSYSLGNTFGVPNAKGTSYIEINAEVPVTEGLKVEVHAGNQKYKGPDVDVLVAGGRDPSYTDYKVGVTQEIKDVEVSLAYSKTNAATGVGTFYNVLGKNLGKGAVVVSAAYTFN